MKKDDYKYLQALVNAQATLLIALINGMSDKGLIDGDAVMADYNKNVKSMIEDLSR